ncbi:MAG: aminoacyl-tRNA hydrolase [Pseudobdellovibrionaceae bacterium]
MWLIVGLGNPGSKYLLTRHNVGFLAIDVLAKSLGIKFTEKFKSEFSLAKLAGEDVAIAKPQTFMNLSGEAVQVIAGFYKIDLDKIIVLHDDVDQPFGQIRLHKNRGHGGNNGIKSITQLMGSMDYARVKIGVSRPPHPDFSVADYVLQNFSDEEMKVLPGILDRSLDAVEAIIKMGVEKASTQFNQVSSK